MTSTPTPPFPPMSVVKLREPLLHRPRLILIVVTSRRNPRRCHSPSQASRYFSHILRARNLSPTPPLMMRTWVIGTLPRQLVESPPLTSQRAPITIDSFEDAQEPEFRPLLSLPSSWATVRDGTNPWLPERGCLGPLLSFSFAFCVH